MARVIIEIEDKENGKVEMKCYPNFQEMVQMLDHNDLTPAHGYALRCINAVREASKEEADKMLIKLPGIRV